MTKINITGAPESMSAETINAVFAWGLAVADIVVVDDNRKVRLGDLTAQGVHYLADYGMAKSLADSVSGVKKQVADADDKGLVKFATEAMAVGSTNRDDIAARIIIRRQSKRFDAIVASALAVRDGTGKRSAEAVWIDNTADAEIRAKHEHAGREMPKGQALKDLRAKYVSAHAARFAGLYAAHVASVAAGASIADDVLGF